MRLKISYGLLGAGDGFAVFALLADFLFELHKGFQVLDKPLTEQVAFPDRKVQPFDLEFQRAMSSLKHPLSVQFGCKYHGNYGRN